MALKTNAPQKREQAVFCVSKIRLQRRVNKFSPQQKICEFAGKRTLQSVIVATYFRLHGFLGSPQLIPHRKVVPLSLKCHFSA